MIGSDGAERQAATVVGRSRVLVRVTAAVLAAVVIGSAAAVTWAEARVDQDVRVVQRVNAQRDAWVQARSQVMREDSIGHAYLAEPGRDLRQALQEAGRSFDAAIGFLAREGEPDDAASARRIGAIHAYAYRTLRRTVALVDAGRMAEAHTLYARPVHPGYVTLDWVIAAVVAREQQEAAARLGDIRRRQHAIRRATPVAAGLGMLTLLVFLLQLFGYERQLVRQAIASRHQALHDALTGLPNRALFTDRVGQALRAADRELRPAALLLLDLDRFKDVNDTLGHPHGDLLLTEVAARLSATLRRVDTVARLGGDEFGMLLPGATGEGAGAVAEKLRAALHRPLTLDGVEVDLDASIGIAVYPQHGGDAAELLQHADVAMYAAKQAHAGFVVYDPAVDQHSPERLALLGGLRRALARDELVLHYQPKTDLRSGRTYGVEALVRWRHPTRGLLGPGEFVPLAERTALIHPLTRWVLNAALDQAAAWRRRGLGLSVAVNLSTRCLLDEGFPDQVADRLAAWEVPARLLVLEVTESAIMADPARALEVLGRLHGLGVGLSVDDFGTGYSSMAYLKTLPVDELKVDRSFVSQMATSSSDAVIVKSTIDLGHNLGLRVVAEGVEDQATQDRLAVLGCDAAQGYHLGRPMPAADLEPLLLRSARAVTGPA